MTCRGRQGSHAAPTPAPIRDQEHRYEVPQVAQASAPSQRRRPPRFLFRFINPLFKLILRSPLHRLFSKRLMLLSFTGRRTGKRYTIVVGYADVGEALLLRTESAWKNNLRGGAPVRVRLRGRERPGTADVISD